MVALWMVGNLEGDWCQKLVSTSDLTLPCEHHDTVYVLDANNQPVQSTPELFLILLQIIIAICTCLRNDFRDYAYICIF